MDELDVCIDAHFEFISIVQPGDVWFRIAIYSKGETPVVLRHSILQEEDFDRNWWEMGDDRLEMSSSEWVPLLSYATNAD